MLITKKSPRPKLQQEKSAKTSGKRREEPQMKKMVKMVAVAEVVVVEKEELSPVLNKYGRQSPKIM